jgi:hypothetical protein
MSSLRRDSDLDPYCSLEVRGTCSVFRTARLLLGPHLGLESNFAGLAWDVVCILEVVYTDSVADAIGGTVVDRGCKDGSEVLVLYSREDGM